MTRAQRLAVQIPVDGKDVVDRTPAGLCEVPACVPARDMVSLTGSWTQDGLGRGRGVYETEDEQEDGGNDEEEGEDHTVCAVAATCLPHGAVLKRVVSLVARAEDGETETYRIDSQRPVSVCAPANVGLLVRGVLLSTAGGDGGMRD